MVTQDRPVVCVSYLASAELWSVPKFPTANQGAAIRSTEHSIAGDAPMAAAVLAALDVPTLLVSNRIGSDDVGSRVGRWLQHRAVPMATVASTEVSTPRIVVVADDHHTRTWFADLPGVADELGKTNLSAIAKASLVYLDAYRLIEEAAVRVVRMARRHGTRLFINLGGEALSRDLRIELAGYRDLVIQTNGDYHAHRSANPGRSVASRSPNRLPSRKVRAAAVDRVAPRAIAIAVRPAPPPRTCCATDGSGSNSGPPERRTTAGREAKRIRELREARERSLEHLTEDVADKLRRSFPPQATSCNTATSCHATDPPVQVGRLAHAHWRERARDTGTHSALIGCVVGTRVDCDLSELGIA